MHGGIGNIVRTHSSGHWNLTLRLTIVAFGLTPILFPPGIGEELKKRPTLQESLPKFFQEQAENVARNATVKR
jgi:hypothetical protein